MSGRLLTLTTSRGLHSLYSPNLTSIPFSGLDDEQLDALQTIFNAAQHVLWVTEDAWVENPQQAMTIGLLRTLRMEYPDIHIQVLDVDKAENLKPDFLVETMLRLEDGR